MKSRPETADYAAVGVGPVLIFLMISSLANFFVMLFYDGNYHDRVFYLILMYTMGAVALARLVIEENRAYSAGYAIGLGAAMLFVMTRFLGNPVFTLGLIVLIGYLADRIVHDCTLIDESVDASGEGLIDRGLDEASGLPDRVNADRVAEETPLTDKERRRRRSHQPGRTVFLLALAALPLFGLGQFMLQDSPRVWARAQLMLGLYLFASLSLLVTTSFLNLRRYLRQRDVDMPTNVTVAWLAGGVAMIAALLILAFLAPMPGAALAHISVPKFLTTGEQNASSVGWGNEAADKFEDESAAETAGDSQPNGKQQKGTGGNGKQSEEAKGQQQSGQQQSGQQQSGQQQSGQQQSGQQQSGQQQSGQQQSGQQQSGQQQSGQQQSGQQQSGQQQSGQQLSGQQQSGQQQSGQQQSGQQQSGQQQSGQQQSGQQQSGQQQSGQQQSGQQQSGQQQSENGKKKADAEAKSLEEGERKQGQNESDAETDDDSKGDEKQSEDDQSESGENESKPGESKASEQQSSNQSDSGSKSSTNSTSPSSMPSLGGALGALGSLLRLLMILGLIAVVGFYLYQIREQLLNWWQSLFSREPANSPSAAPSGISDLQQAPPKPFSAFTNPLGREKDPRRSVLITVHAFDAWVRERGWPRRPDETPSEFIDRLRAAAARNSDASALLQPVESAARSLAFAHDRIVYGRGKARQSDLDAAKKLWQHMTARSTAAAPPSQPSMIRTAGN
ncbi:DUF4129 domain-containing protein [Stieleria sp. TO1_6]|uniref:DUF4129 domain-containing protein n=1 Tax=Stieleria tagensis TaxID=2956795 RepID=UPI00209A7CA7|nr:DUF4129 domain-containing protein [Stieleria tagensis]MCO8123908.1 DUF4129 domain-containing protein [Stieleria tagensis]